MPKVISLADRVAGVPAEPGSHFELCRSQTNPYRNAAYTLELGPFVTRALMSQVDWREVIVIQITQELGPYADGEFTSPDTVLRATSCETVVVTKDLL